MRATGLVNLGEVFGVARVGCGRRDIPTAAVRINRRDEDLLIAGHSHQATRGLTDVGPFALLGIEPRFEFFERIGTRRGLLLRVLLLGCRRRRLTWRRRYGLAACGCRLERGLFDVGQGGQVLLVILEADPRHRRCG